MMQEVQVGVVGPCAAGKSTLIAGLRQRGYRAKHIAQEHSYVADMWQRLTQPDILIYLDVSYPLTLQRRNLNWNQAEYAEQNRRLQHARKHANLYINTDPLTVQEVLEKVLVFLSTPTSSPHRENSH
jgi:deoxyadenosine/deoxycytidine kinase